MSKTQTHSHRKNTRHLCYLVNIEATDNFIKGHIQIIQKVDNLQKKETLFAQDNHLLLFLHCLQNKTLQKYI